METPLNLRAQMAGITLTGFHNLLLPTQLTRIETLDELENIKSIKNKYICLGAGCRSQNKLHIHKYYCDNCNYIRRILCNAYHTCKRSPLLELLSRLLYEYMFDIISLEDIRSKRWLNVSLRDPGHTLRLKICYSRAKKKGQLQLCCWLNKL